MNYSPNKPLISLHIPKCAGTSLTNVLRHWFGRGLRLHYNDEKNNCMPQKYQAGRFSFMSLRKSPICIHGHFNRDRGYGVEQYYPNAEQFITVLRDPFDLHISNYFYVLQQAKLDGAGAYRNGQMHEILRENWSLDDFLKNKKTSHLLTFLPEELTMENYREILDRKFLYVGLTEELQHTVDGLAKLLGFDSVQVPLENVSSKPREVPLGSRELFEENNPLVSAIYNHVKHLRSCD